MGKIAVGADIGGSHINTILMDLESSKVIPASGHSARVNNKDTAGVILDHWKESIEKTLQGITVEQLAGIAFAMPGPFDYTKGIALFTPEVDKYELLYGVNVADRMRWLLQLPAGIPFRFINDATAFAIGEAWVGKAKGFGKSISVTLGTGFGSAFIDRGIPVIDRKDVPAHGNLWYLPFKEGIADDYFSTRWLVKRYAEETGLALHGVREVADEAQKSGHAQALFSEFGRNLGEFMGPWIKKFQTGCVVIGGNITGAYHLFSPGLRSALSDQNIEAAILLSGQTETSAMMGSARLLDDEYWKKVQPLLQ